MKINGIPEVYAAAKYQRTRVQISTEQPQTQKADKAEISAQAESFAAALKSAKQAETPEAEKNRLNTLKSQIDAGTYDIDAREIARRILMKQDENL